MGFGTIACSENANNNDMSFLFGDPDDDGIETWMEYVLDTDPYNEDSDNDGLPDKWEYISEMDPSDSSDAHEDLDYYPYYETSKGECDAQFSAIKKIIDVWPSNPSINFTEPVFAEDGPHYDNYEEYYRPYFDINDDNKLKIMHTCPNNPNTDGDQWLDPDDPRPFNFPCDGVVKTNEIEQIQNNINNNHYIILIEAPPEYNFDIPLDQIDTDKQPPAEYEIYLTDSDNDGIML